VTAVGAVGGPPARRSFGGWQRDRTAVLLGLSGPRVLLLVAAVAVGVAWFVAGERLPTLPAHAAASAALAGLASVRLAGRTADEWALTAACYGLGRARHRHRFLAAASDPIAHSAVGPAAVVEVGPAVTPASVGRPDLPGILAPLRLVEVELTVDVRAVVVLHPYDRTATAVARIHTPGLVGVDVATETRRVSGWATFLAGRCPDAGKVCRVQPVIVAIPDDGQALSRWALDHLDPAAPRAAVASYDDLLTRSAGASVAHAAYLAVSVDLRRARADVAAAGGGDLGGAAAALRQLRALTADVAAAGLSLDGWCTARELAETIRTAFDPAFAGEAARRRVDPDTASGVDVARAGPRAAEAGWGVYRHDSGESVTYQVEGWPASPVHADLLAGLLSPASGRASHRLALTIEPIAPRRADAMLGAARTARSANLAMRARIGQVAPERERAELADAERQDVERAAGHGLCRYLALLTVTATDRADLDVACLDLEAAAARIRLELRRCWGVQDVAFACTLPLGLGLPSRKGVL